MLIWKAFWSLGKDLRIGLLLLPSLHGSEPFFSLVALALAPLTGWSITNIIPITGMLVTSIPAWRNRGGGFGPT